MTTTKTNEVCEQGSAKKKKRKRMEKREKKERKFASVIEWLFDIRVTTIFVLILESLK